MTTLPLEPLAHAAIEDARVQAFRTPIVAGQNVGFSGGPVLTAPEHERLRHIRYGKVYDHFRDDESYDNRIAGEVAYAGPLVNHFGHMISEFVHRIVPSRNFFQAQRFLFPTTFDRQQVNTYEKIPSFIRSILDFFDIGEDAIVFCDRNSIVERLTIAEQGSVMGAVSGVEYLEMMHEFASARLHALNAEPLPSEKVYVGGKAQGGGRILGKSYLQKILAEDGFWIFQPEQFDFSYQAYVYSNAKTLFFSEGSAIHGTSVLGRDMVEDCAVLVRRPGLSNKFYNGLAGRCRSLEMIYATVFVGTIVPTVDGGPAVHHGVSMYDAGSLKSQLRLRDIRAGFRFDEAAYHRACEEDLFAYMAYALEDRAKRSLPLPAYADLLNRFESLRRNLA